jgi:hypothetical protein
VEHFKREINVAVLSVSTISVLTLVSTELCDTLYLYLTLNSQIGHIRRRKYIRILSKW